MIVGVLALQGAFREHLHILHKLHVKGKEVRLASDLEDIDALIIPGGESTTMITIARSSQLIDPLKSFIKSGKPVWGTCAGMILLANKLEGSKQGGQELLGGLNAVVKRNFFGSQLHSFEAIINCSLDGLSSTPVVFIRAPIILSVGENVQIIASIDHLNEDKGTIEKVIIAAQQNSILVTSFHPELTSDNRWHKYFLSLIKKK